MRIRHDCLILKGGQLEVTNSELYKAAINSFDARVCDAMHKSKATNNSNDNNRKERKRDRQIKRKMNFALLKA